MQHEFSLLFTVDDENALVRAAATRLLEQGACTEMEEALDELEGDPARAARILLDPGSLPGCAIMDSGCE